MIVCPECGGENADDSLHCGYCGAALQTDEGAKKTMFGFAAVTDEHIREAQSGGASASEATGKVELPTPQAGLPGSGNVPGAGSLPGASGMPGSSLPKPGGASLPGSRLPTPGEPGDVDEEAKTEMLEAVSGGDAFSSGVSDGPGEPDTVATQALGASDAGTASMADTVPPDADLGRQIRDATTEEKNPYLAAAQESTMGGPEREEDATEPMKTMNDAPAGEAPMPPEASFPQGYAEPLNTPMQDMPQASPDQPMVAGPGGAMGGPAGMGMGGPPGQAPPAKKSNKTLFIIIGVVGGLLFLCCVISIILNFVF